MERLESRLNVRISALESRQEAHANSLALARSRLEAQIDVLHDE